MLGTILIILLVIIPLIVLCSIFVSMALPSWNSLLGDYAPEGRRGELLGGLLRASLSARPALGESANKLSDEVWPLTAFPCAPPLSPKKRGTKLTRPP